MKKINFNSTAALLSALFLTSTIILPAHLLTQILAAAFLCLAITTSVHFSEEIAHHTGPSIGSIILALAVTIIEVALILSLMNEAPAKTITLARDTVFATIMLVTNGIAGLSIVLAGKQKKVLDFQKIGTSSFLAVISTLTLITLILPNYTTSSEGPTFSPAQLITASCISLIIYFVLLYAQTVGHKDYFDPINESSSSRLKSLPKGHTSKDKYFFQYKLFWNIFYLLVSLVSVVGLSKYLAPTISLAAQVLNAPQAMVGIIVAMLILAPETIAAFNAAKKGEIQTSLNLALGSGATSIALTIPVISIYAIINQHQIILGLDSVNITFFSMSFMAGAFTLSTGKTTSLHGMVHLIILISYLAFNLFP